jgi:hypothetical protein
MPGVVAVNEAHKRLLAAAKAVLRLLEHTPGAAKDHWMVQKLRDAVKESEAA